MSYFPWSLFNSSFPSVDLGGRSLLDYLPSSNQKLNLHSFWDAGGMMVQNDSWFMVRPLNTQNMTALNVRALSFMNEFGDEVE